MREEFAAVDGASSILVQLMAEQNRKLVSLACAVVESLSLCMIGREELIRANVISVLHSVLKSVPGAASTALEVSLFCSVPSRGSERSLSQCLLSSREGKAAVIPHASKILRALKDLLREHEQLDVTSHCVHCLASLCETPDGKESVSSPLDIPI